MRKKRRIRQRAGRLRPREVLLFEDETDLLLFPPLRACWAPRGRPAVVQLCGWNARRVVFGTVNPGTGHRLFLVRERQRAGDFRVFLGEVRWHYRGWRVVLLLDEDPSHTARGSQEWAALLGIELVWLPKRCPELNAMDHLWGHGKDHLCANRQSESIDQQAGRFVRFLEGLTNKDARRQAGVLSEDFWLRR